MATMKLRLSNDALKERELEAGQYVRVVRSSVHEQGDVFLVTSDHIVDLADGQEYDRDNDDAVDNTAFERIETEFTVDPLG